MKLTTTQLGELLGLTQRHIYNLEKAEVLKKEDKDCWDGASNIQNYINYKLTSLDGSSDRGKIQARKELAEARLKELAYKEKIGQLIPIEEVAKELQDIAITISNKLYSLPELTKRRHRLKSEVIKFLNEQIEEILTELKDPKIYEQEAQRVESRLEAEKEKERMMIESSKNNGD